MEYKSFNFFLLSLISDLASEEMKKKVVYGFFEFFDVYGVLI